MSDSSALTCALDQVGTKIDGFSSAVNAGISLVPSILRHLLSSVFEKWDEFCTATKRFSAIVSDIASYGWGDADALRRAAVQWGDAVSGVLDAGYEALSNDAIKADTSWKGEAGARYAAGFQNQIDAIRDAKDSAVAISGVLSSHADALDTFYSNLTAGLIGAAASLGGLALSVVALVPPLTPLGIAGLIVSAVGLIVSLYYLFKNEIDDLNRMVDLGAATIEKARTAAATKWPQLVLG